MRPFDGLLCAAALIGAGALLLPASAPAYTTLGGTLDLTQRGFRVHDNFSQPTANANQTPDPRFPGARGAVLAIWKACVEWGSEPFGDGQGDPHQPGDLGSGGANFDAFFLGLADSPGGTNDNVFSEISGQGGGVLAFTELPIADGWRIRFYSDPWVWYDAPAGPPSGADNKDLQGVATHEYGHALGLGHSTNGTTMQGSGGGSFVFMRSIEADDRAGVQFLYGVRASTKPRVLRYTIAGGQAHLEGQHFAPTANEVWFTRAGFAPTTPLVVGGLAATDGGTRLVVPIPPEAGAGNVLVRVPGSGGEALSAAFPFDPAASYCSPAKRYGQAKPTSFGTLPELYAWGVPSVSGAGLRIGTDGAPWNRPGILFSGPAPDSRAFLGGTMLVKGPLVRERHFQTDLFGAVEVTLTLDPALVGTTRCVQMWFHDPGDAFGVGLSDALEFSVCP